MKSFTCNASFSFAGRLPSRIIQTPKKVACRIRRLSFCSYSIKSISPHVFFLDSKQMYLPLRDGCRFLRQNSKGVTSSLLACNSKNVTNWQPNQAYWPNQIRATVLFVLKSLNWTWNYLQWFFFVSVIFLLHWQSIWIPCSVYLYSVSWFKLIPYCVVWGMFCGLIP